MYDVSSTYSGKWTHVSYVDSSIYGNMKTTDGLVNATEVDECIEALDLGEAIALEPERLQPGPLLQALDLVETVVVQVELVVQRRCVVQVLILD